MECANVDKVKPLDELLDDQMKEFDSGEEKECDRDLDKMIWELGDYENEEPLEAAEEFSEEPPIEEELIEKERIRGMRGRASLTEAEPGEEALFAGDLAVGSSLGAETGRKRRKAAGGAVKGKKKK